MTEPHTVRLHMKDRGAVRTIAAYSVPTAPGSMLIDGELYVIDRVRWRVEGFDLSADVYLTGPYEDE